ncbi:phosphoglycerate kinase [Spiroplasma mirum ATCC 29335]|uniref:Phosphoglycerate kinase n=1 Tax=Spiroplasma mirum ATCC 29335 TaxID=838561 RepID=W0GMA5_9MOLU|nr:MULTISPECIES: phosphoglycerate kinase [Spiroplasma]AHF61395.1 phosphoglycerate kinase [Spiroplasma mirum ATCC 29335]AHI58523.1 phosphoglycerate kinase [Spiroplasma mirum ATCC 29335]AKM53447.1 phosphoglycerate kinase [Spiroplasma atrichopogonis]
MAKKELKDVEICSKKVLVRVDFNVPMKDGVITDDNRITAALPTIKYLIDHNAKVILFSHLGKVKTEADLKKRDIAPVAKALSDKLGMPVKFVNAFEGPELEAAIAGMKDKDIILFQNTRFADILDANGNLKVDENGNAKAKRESKNDPALGKYWASLGDVFVNDAFGTAHRAHASNVGIATNIGLSCLGFLVEKEVKMLAQGVDNPVKPFVAIIGGAKVSDKIGVIDHLLTKADKIIIGGGMAYTFFVAQGHKIGNSLLEEDKIEVAKEFLAKANSKIILPVDALEAPEFADVPAKVTDGVDIDEGYMGLDIGPKTIELFKKELAGAKTVAWNGPMGVFEFSHYSNGTKAVCEAIAQLPDAFTLIGGGDSAAAAIQLGYKDKFTHISTGGGASLEYMEGKTLPGIEAVQDK